jgi:hypothetical protein
LIAVTAAVVPARMDLGAVAAGLELPPGAADSYRTAHPGSSNADLFMLMMSDALFRMPSTWGAEAHAGLDTLAERLAVACRAAGCSRTPSHPGRSLGPKHHLTMRRRRCVRPDWPVVDTRMLVGRTRPIDANRYAWAHGVMGANAFNDLIKRHPWLSATTEANPSGRSQRHRKTLCVSLTEVGTSS